MKASIAALHFILSSAAKYTVDGESLSNELQQLGLPKGTTIIVFEPRHDKTCLREFPTRPDTNQPAQPQKLARVLKFRLKNLEIPYYLSSEQQRR